MKKLQVISTDVQPSKPASNMLVVIDDKIIHYDNNGNPFAIKSEDQGQISIEWSDVLNKPATFTPSSHSHSYSEITGKPTTFTPSAHTHTIANVTGLQTALDGKSDTGHTHSFSELSAVPSTATRWPSWSEVTSKPSTFTPSAHTHAWAEITDKPALLTIGTTASTAKAGNYTPSATEVLAAINNMTPEQLTELKTLLGITSE